MTPEGIVLWLAGFIVVPLLTGQLRNTIARFQGLAAVALAIVISLILGAVVQLFFGGGFHAPRDFADFVSEALILFGLAQVAYKVIVNAISSPHAAARLVG